MLPQPIMANRIMFRALRSTCPCRAQGSVGPVRMAVKDEKGGLEVEEAPHQFLALGIQRIEVGDLPPGLVNIDQEPAPGSHLARIVHDAIAHHKLAGAPGIHGPIKEAKLLFDGSNTLDKGHKVIRDPTPPRRRFDRCPVERTNRR